MPIVFFIWTTFISNYQIINEKEEEEDEPQGAYFFMLNIFCKSYHLYLRAKTLYLISQILIWVTFWSISGILIGKNRNEKFFHRRKTNTRGGAGVFVKWTAGSLLYTLLFCKHSFRLNGQQLRVVWIYFRFSVWEISMYTFYNSSWDYIDEIQSIQQFLGHERWERGGE